MSREWVKRTVLNKCTLGRRREIPIGCVRWCAGSSVVRNGARERTKRLASTWVDKRYDDGWICIATKWDSEGRRSKTVILLGLRIHDVSIHLESLTKDLVSARNEV